MPKRMLENLLVKNPADSAYRKNHEYYEYNNNSIHMLPVLRVGQNFPLSRLRERAGVRALAMVRNRLQYRFRILQRFIIPKSHYGKALLLQKAVTILVISLSFCVLPAIQFYNDLMFHTGKIRDVRPYGTLTAKLQAKQPPVAQVIP